MGLFDFLKSKREKEPEDPAASLRGQLGGWQGMDDAAKCALLETVFGEVSPHLESPSVKTNLDGPVIELRAQLNGIPVRSRVEVWTDWVDVEAKLVNNIGTMILERDHSKIPQAKTDGDWSDEDQIRVFVAKGIFAEGDKDVVDETLESLSALPDPFRETLFEEMERLSIASLAIDAPPNPPKANAGWAIGDLHDPSAQIVGCLKLLTGSAEVFARGDREPRERGAAVGSNRVRCSYCSTLFLLTGFTCPNCGAPYSG